VRGCLLGCVTLLTPRVLILLLAIFTAYIDRAFDTFIWPLLGFLFLPIVTLAYAVAQNELPTQNLLWWAVVVLGVLLDLGFIGSGSWGVRDVGKKWR
jgi:hypothetical protein